MPQLENQKEEDPLQLQKIFKALPAEVLEKNLFKSVAHMLFDFSVWGGSILAIKALVSSSAWVGLPLLAKAAASLAYWNVAGFFMWCIFVVGHDCGHTTFSNYKWVNNILGHVTHSSLLVPFFPWALSHRRHHMYHNHVDKDYSYKWYTPEKLNAGSEFMARKLHDSKVSMFMYPFVAWQLYVLGIDDGSHLIPFANQRLWKDTPAVEKRKCWISFASVVAAATGIFALNGFDAKNVLFYYGGPHVMFSWWLFCVTYLQHHGPKTMVYGDKNWDYVKAGFETVDRTFGKVIDHLHHHITDGHVIHHLFFTKIPHYNLMKATAALRKYLADNKVEDVYRYEDTRDFPIRVHKYMVTTGFHATEAKVPETVVIPAGPVVA